MFSWIIWSFQVLDVMAENLSMEVSIKEPKPNKPNQSNPKQPKPQQTKTNQYGPIQTKPN